MNHRAKTLCPCDSKKAYAKCCQPWHQGQTPPNAELLMRSRYSAYVLDVLDYLRATWHPSTCPSEITPNPPELKWLGLSIRHHRQPTTDEAYVEFIARSRLHGQPQRLHEISRFVFENQRWWYVDGEFPENDKTA